MWKDNNAIVGIFQIQYFADLHGWLLPPPDEESTLFWDFGKSFDPRPSSPEQPREFGLAGIVSLIEENRTDFEREFGHISDRIDLLLLGGDIFSMKSPYCALDQGETLLGRLRQLGVNVFLLGNHDIEDLALHQLSKAVRVMGGGCSTLGVNAVIKGMGAPQVRPSIEYRLGGGRIVIAGVTIGKLNLDEHDVECGASGLKLQISDPKEIVAPMLRDLGEDPQTVVLTMTHCDPPGMDEGTAGWIAAQHGAQIILSGHNHTIVAGPDLCSTGQNGQGLIRMRIALKTDGKMEVQEAPHFQRCKSFSMPDGPTHALANRLNEECGDWREQSTPPTEMPSVVAEAVYRCPDHRSCAVTDHRNKYAVIMSTTVAAGLPEGTPRRGHLMRAVPRNDRIVQGPIRGSELGHLKQFQAKLGDRTPGLVFYPSVDETDFHEMMSQIFTLTTTLFTWRWLCHEAIWLSPEPPHVVCRLHHCIFQMFKPGTVWPEASQEFNRCAQLAENNVHT